ncbi:MAG: hypothetical protein ACK4Q5_21965, partial [Saprospiraceae bacterium]
AAEGGARLQAIDPVGRVAVDVPFRDGGAIDVGGLAPGMHLLRVIGADGSPIAHERLLILR